MSEILSHWLLLLCASLLVVNGCAVSIADNSHCSSGQCGGVTAGTMISTPTGLRAVEHLSIGDLVWGYNELHNEMEVNSIVSVFGPMNSTLVSLSVVVEGKHSHSYCAPTMQSIFSNVNSSYVRAGQLTGSAVSVLSFHRAQIDVLKDSLPCYPKSVYQIEVLPSHCYFMGPASILVHNPQPRNLNEMLSEDRGYDIDPSWRNDDLQYVYRALTETQEASVKKGLGISAKNPANMIKPAAHVKTSDPQTNWISTSKDPLKAAVFGIRDHAKVGGQVVRIDLDRVRHHGSTVFDVSTGDGMADGPVTYPIRLAKKYEEVLIDGFIPQDAIVHVGQVTNSGCLWCKRSRLNGQTVSEP